MESSVHSIEGIQFKVIWSRALNIMSHKIKNMYDLTYFWMGDTIEFAMCAYIPVNFVLILMRRKRELAVLLKVTLTGFLMVEF